MLAVFLFILVFAWNFYARILNVFKNLKPSKSQALSSWQLKYLKVATWFGLLAEVCLAFLLFPIVRGPCFRFSASSLKLQCYFLPLSMVQAPCSFGGSATIQEETWKWQNTGRI